mmetsp:Transcript_21718/g.53064  ORF Transcript_21718/g.53064 Transcript_21718/m.53064 type:complete len:129 (-) Transcript_21718:52-438(-)|eukprot:CAMPEP_0198308934 /NCGR_PEP_ID=MMETSP1450-20131203/1427_1 /TAXON_ID=753684 ORGANISM="Madagascaria erythrocladiodes, Strain CCMP3234" /NCGR_SAMPLE_ID=MMETSP1450 /ASSEMBLY_ACC=CAM_ASM_001115 /LENGTH=128 /DNA_ID=CAMNT_0044011651 /DNA_START=59 /DNA_END=445 /DNA_ORIENTATION=+
MTANSKVTYLHAPCLTDGSGCTDCGDDCGNDAKMVSDEIKKHKVIVFSKSYCPFCKAVKKLFDEQGVAYTVVELDKHKRGAEVQKALLDLTGQRTVPSVHINGKHVGGASDTFEKHEAGELAKLIADA